MSDRIRVKGGYHVPPGLSIDLSIHPDVDLTNAFSMLRNASGVMAEGLRKVALRMAEDRLRAAHRIRSGAIRHSAVKTRRDTLKRLRKLEAQRRGWIR